MLVYACCVLDVTSNFLPGFFFVSLNRETDCRGHALEHSKSFGTEVFMNGPSVGENRETNRYLKMIFHSLNFFLFVVTVNYLCEGFKPCLVLL